MNGDLACWPSCGEPLICTFERKFKEFHCLVCGRWWEFLQPIGKPITRERQARYDLLLARFKAGHRGPSEATP